jgi:hypothetical protein
MKVIDGMFLVNSPLKKAKLHIMSRKTEQTLKVQYAIVKKGRYTQTSIKRRIEALFLDNINRVVTREQIIEVAIDPITGKQPENWHQRLSELRTDDGYTILSWRNRGWLRVEEYLMPNGEKRVAAGKRVKPTADTWREVLANADSACQWTEDNQICGLRDGEIDPIGGGSVKLTADHKSPHSVNPDADPNDSNQWQVLCGRHQVMKKNYWDSNTGKMNIYAIIQSATAPEKEIVFKFLLDYFGYVLEDDGTISKYV